MESPFLDVLIPARKTASEWNNANDEIILKSPLIDPVKLNGESQVVKPKIYNQHSPSDFETENFSDIETDSLNQELDLDGEFYYENPYSEKQVSAVKSETEVELNTKYSQDLGWGNYSDKINDLFLKATKQSSIPLYGDRFALAVTEWKRQSSSPLSIINGVIDMETWKKMSAEIGVSPLIFSITDHYRKMNLSAKGLSLDAFKIACNGFRKLEKDRQLKNNKVLSIADFTQSSKKKRLYILDMAGQKLILQIKVAHGVNSVKPGDSKDVATLFSNVDGSHQSSLGFYVTQETFTMGDHIDKKGIPHIRGYSLYIEGMEKGFNDLARKRKIWIHPAEYVKDKYKIIGMSWGCPAIDFKVRNFVINTIKEGTCFFIYFNDPVYLEKSLLATDSTFGLAPGVSHEYEYEDDNEWEEMDENETQQVLSCEDSDEETENENLFEQQFVFNPKDGNTVYLNVSAIKGQSLTTGVFIPSLFSQVDKVDLILYLHGQYKNGNKKNGIDSYWNDYSNIREFFYESQRNGILIAPTLGSNPESLNVLLKNKNGLDDFVSACFAELKSKGLLSTSAKPFRIILAAHSAGGSPLSKILGSTNALLSNVIECWGFDCLIDYKWPEAFKKSLTKKFYHYWAYTKTGDQSDAGNRGDTLQRQYCNVKNIMPCKIVYHPDIIEYAWINEINKRPWFDPIISAPSGVIKEAGDLEIEKEDDEFNPYNEGENAESYEEPEAWDERKFYELYNPETNRDQQEENIETEDDYIVTEEEYESEEEIVDENAEETDESYEEETGEDTIAEYDNETDKEYEEMITGEYKDEAEEVNYWEHQLGPKGKGGAPSPSTPSIAVISSRLDKYLNESNPEYTLRDGITKVKARHVFAYGWGVTPILDRLKRKIKNKLGNKVYNKFQKKGNYIITNALYGRAKPGELKSITQALIDSTRSPLFTGVTADDIRILQDDFSIGIDCAGYVQLAFFFSIYGDDNDAKSKRTALGLKDKRGSEKLAELRKNNKFTEINKLDAQTGDLMIMDPRPSDGDNSNHTVIVVSHVKTGDVHEYTVDASWGTDAYGFPSGGVDRRTLCYDEAKDEWWDIHPITKLKVTGFKIVLNGAGEAFLKAAEPADPGYQETTKIGPYLGHKIQGVYRKK